MQSECNESKQHQSASHIGALFVAAAPDDTTGLRHTIATKVLSHLFSPNHFDAAFADHLHRLQTAAISNIVMQDDFYTNAAHPLRRLIECVVAHGRTWYARDSRPSQVFYQKFSALIDAALHHINEAATPQAADTEGHEKRLQGLVDEFNHWAEGEEKRAEMLEKRLCETEIQHVNLLRIECQVIDLLNRLLSGTYLPTELAAAVPTLLKTAFQHAELADGPQAALLKTWQKLTPFVKNIFVHPDTADDQQLYRDIPILSNELERSLGRDSDSAPYREFVALLNQVLMRLVQKQTQSCELFNKLPYPEDVDALKNTSITTTALEEAELIQQGEWILFSGENNQLIRCKLALKNKARDQLLFVDNTGRKVMLKSNRDFSLCISTGIAQRLPYLDLNQVINKAIYRLIELGRQKSAQLEAQIAAKAQAKAELLQQAERQQAQTRAEQQQRNQQQAAARLAAAHKALAEAQLLAQQKAEREEVTRVAREAEQHAEQERIHLQLETERQYRQQLAVEKVLALNVGAWIELDNAGNTLRCKLAVVISAAGKYIFVDNLGRKVAEHSREQLVQAYIDNRLTLINNGDRFEDQLAKVIRGLRKDIS